ncbi:hypothetical protein A2U01_0109725, partial [Trifolium medium]|nr:hypothetical protein [Trifolium medium]
MRQRRWLEFLKDYDFELSYHPGKSFSFERLFDQCSGRCVEQEIIAHVVVD